MQIDTTFVWQNSLYTLTADNSKIIIFNPYISNFIGFTLDCQYVFFIEIFTFLLHVVCLVTIERFEWSKQCLCYQGPKLHYRVTVLCCVVCTVYWMKK